MTVALSQTPERKAWRAMISRCYNPNHPGFKNYGGRGIVVCEEWRASFQAFFAHVGQRPEGGYSLDRINVNGNYEPGNVRWATYKQQAINRRCTHFVTIGGATKRLAEWAEEYGVPIRLIYDRYSSGWSMERAITQPINQYRSKAANSRWHRPLRVRCS